MEGVLVGEDKGHVISALLAKLLPEPGLLVSVGRAFEDGVTDGLLCTVSSAGWAAWQVHFAYSPQVLVEQGLPGPELDEH